MNLITQYSDSSIIIIIMYTYDPYLNNINYSKKYNHHDLLNFIQLFIKYYNPFLPIYL